MQHELQSAQGAAASGSNASNTKDTLVQWLKKVKNLKVAMSLANNLRKYTLFHVSLFITLTKCIRT
jgi:hypothetical protein